MNLLDTSSLYAADGRHVYSVNDLRPFFLGASNLPVRVPHADVINPSPARQDSPALSYSFVSGKGYSLVWEREAPFQGQHRPVMMSVQNAARMDEWMENPDQSMFPVGSLVPGDVAIRVVEDFARNPNVLSGAVDWVDIMTLRWPEP